VHASTQCESCLCLRRRAVCAALLCESLYWRRLSAAYSAALPEPMGEARPNSIPTPEREGPPYGMAILLPAVCAIQTTTLIINCTSTTIIIIMTIMTIMTVMTFIIIDTYTITTITITTITINIIVSTIILPISIMNTIKMDTSFTTVSTIIMFNITIYSIATEAKANHVYVARNTDTDAYTVVIHYIECDSHVRAQTVHCPTMNMGFPESDVRTTSNTANIVPNTMSTARGTRCGVNSTNNGAGTPTIDDTETDSSVLGTTRNKNMPQRSSQTWACPHHPVLPVKEPVHNNVGHS
jgi:hypothetical protein